jgi:molecular chaperone DnaJ
MSPNMADNKRDYYEVLEIPRNASKDDIRAAFRRLAKQYHPDANKDPGAEARFKEAAEAYEVLNDDEARARYDRYGHAGLEQSGFQGFGFGGGFGFEDVLSDLFGFGGRPGRPGPARGADLRYDLEIKFEEAVFGCSKEVQVSRQETCPECRGSGAEPGTTPTRCTDCGGSGQIRRAQQSIFGSFVNVTTCPRCRGAGEVVGTPCTVCRGSQRVEQTRKLQVEVPAGVDDEMRIRLAGEGEGGIYGGPAGNLYVMLHVKPHAFLQRRENDLVMNININVAQAALGDEIRVPTVDGEEKMTIAAGTQTGAVARLKGHGAPRLRGSGRGDQIVIINVAVPTSLDPQQRELFAQLGKTLGREVTPQTERGFVDRLREALGI